MQMMWRVRYGNSSMEGIAVVLIFLFSLASFSFSKENHRSHHVAIHPRARVPVAPQMSYIRKRLPDSMMKQADATDEYEFTGRRYSDSIADPALNFARKRFLDTGLSVRRFLENVLSLSNRNNNDKVEEEAQKVKKNLRWKSRHVIGKWKPLNETVLQKYMEKFSLDNKLAKLYSGLKDKVNHNFTLKSNGTHFNLGISEDPSIESEKNLLEIKDGYININSTLQRNDGGNKSKGVGMEGDFVVMTEKNVTLHTSVGKWLKSIGLADRNSQLIWHIRKEDVGGGEVGGNNTSRFYLQRNKTLQYNNKNNNNNYSNNNNNNSKSNDNKNNDIYNNYGKNNAGVSENSNNNSSSTQNSNNNNSNIIINNNNDDNSNSSKNNFNNNSVGKNVNNNTDSNSNNSNNKSDSNTKSSNYSFNDNININSSSNTLDTVSNDNDNSGTNMYKNTSYYNSNKEEREMENSTVSEHLSNSALKQNETTKWDGRLPSMETMKTSMVSDGGNVGEADNLKEKNISNMLKSGVKSDDYVSSDIDVEVAPLSQSSVLNAYNDVNKAISYNNSTVSKNTNSTSNIPMRENHAQKFDVAYGSHAPLQLSQTGRIGAEEKEEVGSLINGTVLKKNTSNSNNVINTSNTTTISSNEKDDGNNSNNSSSSNNNSSKNNNISNNSNDDDKDDNTSINNNERNNMTTNNIKIIHLNEHPSLANALTTTLANQSAEYKSTGENEVKKEKSDNSSTTAHADEEKGDNRNSHLTMEETNTVKNLSLPVGKGSSYALKKKKKKIGKEEDNDEFDAASNDDNPEEPFDISKFAENASGGTSLTNTSLLKQMIVEQLKAIQMTKDVASKVIGGESNESANEEHSIAKVTQNAIKENDNEQTVEWKTSKEEERLSDASESKDDISKTNDKMNYDPVNSQNKEFDSKTYRSRAHESSSIQNEDRAETHKQEDSKSNQVEGHTSGKYHEDQLDLEIDDHSPKLDQNSKDENAHYISEHQTKNVSKTNQNNELISDNNQKGNDSAAMQNKEYNSQNQENEKNGKEREEASLSNDSDKYTAEDIQNINHSPKYTKNTERMTKEKENAIGEDDDSKSSRSDEYVSMKNQNEKHKLKSNRAEEEKKENEEMKKEEINEKLSQKENGEEDEGNEEKEEENDEEDSENIDQMKTKTSGTMKNLLVSEKEQRNETTSPPSGSHNVEEPFNKRNITNINNNGENDNNNYSNNMNHGSKMNYNDNNMMEALQLYSNSSTRDLDNNNNNSSAIIETSDNENNSDKGSMNDTNKVYDKKVSFEHEKDDANNRTNNNSSNSESNSEHLVSQLKQVDLPKHESDDDISYTNEDDGGFEGDSEEANNSEELAPLQSSLQVKNVKVNEAANRVGNKNLTTTKKKNPNTSGNKESEEAGNSENSSKIKSQMEDKSNSALYHRLSPSSNSVHKEREKAQSISQLKEPNPTNNDGNVSYTHRSRHSTAKSVKRVLLIKHNFDEEDDDDESSAESSGDEMTKKDSKKHLASKDLTPRPPKELDRSQKEKEKDQEQNQDQKQQKQIPSEEKQLLDKTASTLATTFHEVGLAARDDKIGGGGGITSGGSPPTANHHEKHEHADHGEEGITAPKIIDIENVDNSFCSMAKKLTVKYRDNAGKVETIDCGGNYNYSNAFEHAPLVGLDRANINGIYTFLMLDADAPSPFYPVARCVVHWMVVNIIEADLGRGSIVVPYKPPDPITTTGPHRYVFLLLKQKEMEPVKDFNLENQCNLDVNKFANRHNITYIEGFKYFTTQSKIDYLVLTQRHNL